MNGRTFFDLELLYIALGILGAFCLPNILCYCCKTFCCGENKETKESDDKSKVPKVKLDPEQMVQLLNTEEPLSETIPQVLSSNAIENQENIQSGSRASHFVRLDSEQMEILIKHQQQKISQKQESRSTTEEPTDPIIEINCTKTNNILPPSYDEYTSICEKKT